MQEEIEDFDYWAVDRPIGSIGKEQKSALDAYNLCLKLLDTHKKNAYVQFNQNNQIIKYWLKTGIIRKLNLQFDDSTNEIVCEVNEESIDIIKMSAGLLKEYYDIAMANK